MQQAKPTRGILWLQTRLNQSEFLQHEPCPKCGSSDALARYSDGHAHCFSCSYYEASPDTECKVTEKTKENNLIAVGESRALPSRKLTEETCKKWGYTLSTYKGEPVQVANYRDMNGVLIAQKLRFKDKKFKCLGNMKEAGLYGQHLWRDGGKRVVITEGEIDALSVSQLQGNKWPVVSLPNGAQAAKKALQNSFEWLDKFAEIVLLFDNDEYGQKAVEDCMTIKFKAGKVKVAKLPLKDANAMLQAGRGTEVVSAIYEAKTYRPDGILDGSELWDLVSQEDTTTSFALPFQRLTEITHGIRSGEVWTFTAGSGIGKSAVVREITYHAIQSGHTVGVLMLEENIKRTARGLIGLSLNKPAHICWEELTDEEKKQGFDATLGTGRIFLYDHFGSSEIENILSKIRYLVAGCGCQIIVLDHLSIIISGTEDGDERRLIDYIMTELKTLAVELNIALILVSHLKRPNGDRGHEDGAQTSLSQLRGSHAIAQLSDFVIGLERNQLSEQSNITTIRILKNRYTGETGVGGWLSYDLNTGRLTELFNDPFQKEEAVEDFSEDTESMPF